MDFLLVDTQNLLLERKTYQDVDHIVDHILDPIFGANTTVLVVSFLVGTRLLGAAFQDDALEDIRVDGGCYLARHLFAGNVLLFLLDGGPMDDGLVDQIRKDLKFVSADYVRRKALEAEASAS
jgi:hypothetical protein